MKELTTHNINMQSIPFYYMNKEECYNIVITLSGHCCNWILGPPSNLQLKPCSDLTNPRQTIPIETLFSQLPRGSSPLPSWFFIERGRG